MGSPVRERVLQWVGNHERLLRRLMERLAPGGSLAIQMPDNLDEPCHLAMREVARSAPFATKLSNASKARTAIHGEAWYYAHLKPLSSRVDIWRTTYYHPLAGGVDAIVNGSRGPASSPSSSLFRMRSRPHIWQLTAMSWRKPINRSPMEP